MRRTRWQRLAAITIAVGALATWLTTWLEQRGPGMPQVPWLVVAVELVLAAVVLWMGWAVRQYQRGKRPTLDGIRAARTAVLAKAACYTGALLTGWYGGQSVAYLLDVGTPGKGSRAAAAAIAAGGALVLAGVGLLVEWFCRIPPPSDEEGERGVPDPTAI